MLCDPPLRVTCGDINKKGCEGGGEWKTQGSDYGTWPEGFRRNLFSKMVILLIIRMSNPF